MYKRQAEGQVKLLDFGVSKLLAPDGDALAATEFGDRALTPEYASPEQVQGGPITVATDVYGLGAVSYTHLDVYKRQPLWRWRLERLCRPIAQNAGGLQCVLRPIDYRRSMGGYGAGTSR